MPPISYTPLPPSQVQDRDPNFTYPSEAEAIAVSLLADSVGATAIPDASGVKYAIVQATPTVPNTNDDGREYDLINFTLPQIVTDPQTQRQLSQNIAYSEVAGELLPLLSKVGQPWKFTPSLQDGKWIGDVEREG